MITHLLKFLLLFLALTLQLSAADSLKLIHPNGGEVLKAGANTKILWKGIPDTTSLEIKFSSDNGKSWYVLSGKAKTSEYIWSTPDIKSDSCLIILNQSKYIPINDRLIWQKSFGGSKHDYSTTILQTADSGFFVVGYSLSKDGDVYKPNAEDYFSGYDFWIVKSDSIGNLEWQKSFGGNRDEYAYNAIQTHDGGYLIVGSTKSIDGDIKNPKDISSYKSDYWILKIDSKGDLEWEKSYGGEAEDAARSVLQTVEGDYIIAGYSQSKGYDITNPAEYTDSLTYDYWILKLDTKGGLIWEKSYGGSKNDVAYSIELTLDGNYIVAGSSESNNGNITNPKGNNDYWIIKLDTNGDLIWEKSFGGSGTDWARSILRTNDGGYAVAGRSDSKDLDNGEKIGEIDYWVLKLNINGEIEWQKSYGGSATQKANSIIQTSDNGFIIAGSSISVDGDITNPKGGRDSWIVKTMSNGEIEWQMSLGGTKTDEANSIIETKDGNFIISGSSESNDGDISHSFGRFDYWITKISSPYKTIQSDTSDAVFSIVKPDESEPDTKDIIDYFVYGNSQSNSATAAVVLEEDTDITIEVYDLLGRRIMEIYSGLAEKGRNEYKIDYDDYQSGRYFVKLTSPKKTQTEIIEILW